ncbi:MAG: amidohydrolase family protein [Acidobacteriia bacterium]|nr:amidohydrolase family protein [Terriglobia bacterium]
MHRSCSARTHACRVHTRVNAWVFFALALLTPIIALAEPADWIYSARYVVTMDARRQLIENGAVALRGDRIVAVGKRADIDRQFQARHRLDRPDALIMPGLINTHTHAAMSLFRGIADDLKLQDWLEKYIFPAEAKNVTPDFVLWGTRLAALEMMLSGTTTFVDMYYFEDQVARATKEAGLRGVLGETILRFKSPDAATPKDALALTEKFIQQYKNDPLIVPAPAPHAIYTNDDADLRSARKLANKYGVPLVIHLSETKTENDDAVRVRGMTPTRLLDALGVLDGPTIAAHGVWLDDADMQILKAHATGIAHCPSSNMKLASGVAPVIKLLSLGIPTGLGTDGPAGSNNDFDLMEEMNLAADLQKVTASDPTVLPAEQAVAMATILGARVASLDKEIGSLEPGKRADLITLRLDRPHAVPLYNVYSQIVYALKGSDVQDVVVNGKPIVRDSRSLTLDSNLILSKAKEYAAKVSASLR